jgi:hypothetical protein
MLTYSFADEKVTKDSSLNLVVHHPRFGIALKQRMDELGIECIVQYRDTEGKKKLSATARMWPRSTPWILSGSTLRKRGAAHSRCSIGTSKLEELCENGRTRRGGCRRISNGR